MRQARGAALVMPSAPPEVGGNTGGEWRSDGMAHTPDSEKNFETQMQALDLYVRSGIDLFLAMLIRLKPPVH